jgi:hypothetical protein
MVRHLDVGGDGPSTSWCYSTETKKGADEALSSQPKSLTSLAPSTGRPWSCQLRRPAALAGTFYPGSCPAELVHANIGRRSCASRRLTRIFLRARLTHANLPALVGTRFRGRSCAGGGEFVGLGRICLKWLEEPRRPMLAGATPLPYRTVAEANKKGTIVATAFRQRWPRLRRSPVASATPPRRRAC